MECCVRDHQIVPAQWLLRCDIEGARTLSYHYAFAPGAGFYAYSAAERDEIAAALDELKLPYTIEPVDQPDPAHLALLQGTVNSRTEALDALDALGQGETPDIDKLRLKQLETKVADLEAAKEAQL